MDKNNHGTTQRTKVFTTTPGRIILKHAAKWAIVGLLIGIAVSVFFGLGLHNELFATATADNVVARVASNEKDYVVTDGTIDVNKLGISFEFGKAVKYDGNPHKVELTGADRLPAGVTVTYVNNEHTDVGTYRALAILSGEGYVTKVLETDIVIEKATIKGVTLEDRIFEYVEGQTYEVKVTGDLPAGTTVEYSYDYVSEVGTYKTVAVIYGKNYETLTLEATVHVVDLKQLVGFDSSKLTFTYDTKAHTVTLDTSKVIAEIKTGRNFKVEYNQNTFTNAGTYDVVATVSADGFTTFTVATQVVVNKGDLEKVAGLKVSADDVVYDGEAHYASHTDLPEGVTATVKYFMNGSEVDATVVTGVYTAVFTFVDANGNYEDKTLTVDFEIEKMTITDGFTFNGKAYDYYQDPDTLEAKERSINITYALASLTNKYGITAVSVKYVYGNQESDSPLKFTEVGEYTVKVVITYDEKSNKLYKPTELEATLVINYDVMDLEGINAETTQIAFVNGKALHPTCSGDLEGVTVEYLLDGEVVEGVKYIGIYDMQIRYTKGNYQATTGIVNFIVLPSPILAVALMLIFALIGMLVGLIGVLVSANREQLSETHFIAPSAAVAKVRSGVICESYAKYNNNGKEGRLYLSKHTLEFYSEDYKKASNNFLINVSDIRNVNVLSHNKIQVYANHDVHVFTVPGGRAADWATEILNI